MSLFAEMDELESNIGQDVDSRSVSKSFCASLNSMTIANGNRNNLNLPSSSNKRNRIQACDILRELLMIERTFAKELQLTSSWIHDFFETDLCLNLSSGESLMRFLSFLESLSDVHDNYLSDLEECICNWSRELTGDACLSFAQFKSLTNPILSCLQVQTV